MTMVELSKFTAKELGQLIKQRRKELGSTQRDLALTTNSGLRFIIELEQGKPTCQIEKVLTVLRTLGLRIMIQPR